LKTTSVGRMASSALQICALLLAVAGFTILLLTTMSNRWKISDTTTVLVTADWVSEGLWMDCAVAAFGSIQCKKFPYMLNSDSKCAWRAQRKSRAVVLLLLSGQRVSAVGWRMLRLSEGLVRTGSVL